MLGKNALIGFVATLDFERARAFYGGTLGLELLRDDGFALVFRAGANMLRVVKVDGLRPQPFTVLGWEVDDVQKTVAALRERGVTFEEYAFLDPDDGGVWTAPGGDQVAWFKDPDGNTLSISHHV